MEEVNALRIKAPVSIGDVLIENICGTGVPLVRQGIFIRRNFRPLWETRAVKFLKWKAQVKTVKN